MADFEADNAVVRESLSQVPGRMDLFQGNMKAILELPQTQRAPASANPADDNVTRAAGVTNPATATGATVETPVETVVPTTENCQLVPADMNRLTAAYPWGMPLNFSAHFAHGGAFFPHPTLIAPAATGNPAFAWGIPTVQTPPIDVANPEDNQGQVPNETPDAEGEYRGPCLHFHIPSQVAQPASANQATPFNPTLQYVQTRAPRAPNAQAGGQYPHMVHATQTVPPGFSYPPHMLFAP